MAFAQNLKRLRESKGYSQADLGAAIEVSDRTVSTWERAIKMPNLDTAIKISQFLHVSLDELIEDKELFIIKVSEEYGHRGKEQANVLVSQLTGLFSGGQLNEDDRDAVFQAMSEAYFDAKQKSKKYTPLKYTNQKKE